LELGVVVILGLNVGVAPLLE
jgi:hypothetical protein